MTGIMGRARGLQIGENGVHVAVMFLLLGFFLSVVNLPGASGDTEVVPSPNPPEGGSLQPAIAPPPGSRDLSSPPPPPVATPSPDSTSEPSGDSPPAPPPPPPREEGISPSSSPSPSPSPTTATTTSIVRTRNTWNESEKAGVVIAAIAALLQVAVVGFLLIKRHQMLTTAEYGDIDDLEYENPRDSNFRHAESV